MKTIELTDDDLKNIKVVLDYLLDSERKHYEEQPDVNHIYAITQRLNDCIIFQLKNE